MPQELGAGVRAALDALDEAADAAPSRPTELGATYYEVRPALEGLLAALAEDGGEAARVGRVLENLMAGADTITGLAAGPEGRTP